MLLSDYKGKNVNGAEFDKINEIVEAINQLENMIMFKR